MGDYRITGSSQYNKRFGNSKDESNGGARKGARAEMLTSLMESGLRLGKIYRGATINTTKKVK